MKLNSLPVVVVTPFWLFSIVVFIRANEGILGPTKKMQEKSLRSAELGDRFGFFYASHGKLRQMTVEDCTDFSS